MNKKAGRFLQSLAKKSKTRTSRRKRTPFMSALARRLDREVERAGNSTATRTSPRLVKRGHVNGPTDSSHKDKS
jgi:hypothetical protein